MQLDSATEWTLQLDSATEWPPASFSGIAHEPLLWIDRVAVLLDFEDMRILGLVFVFVVVFRCYSAWF